MSKKAAEEAAALEKISAYMRAANRPYSAVDTTTNLRKEFGKALVVKTLEALTDSQALSAKSFGKQRVYFAQQEGLPVLDAVELQALDQRIAQLTDANGQLQESVKGSASRLRAAAAARTTAELAETAGELRRRSHDLHQRLDQAKDQSDGFSEEALSAASASREAAVSEARRRRALSKRLLATIAESYPHSQKKLHDAIGIPIRQ